MSTEDGGGQQSQSRSADGVPVGGEVGNSPGSPLPAEFDLHDDSRRRRLRLRLSVGTQETMRSVALAHRVTEAGLLDALLHGLEAADPAWLDGVIERAREMDAHYRDEGTHADAGGSAHA